MNIQSVRGEFSSLDRDQIFLDNAAGSQMVKSCIVSIHNYLSQRNVGPWNPYPVSAEATSRLEEGFEATGRFINAEKNEIVFGASTTQLVRNVSQALTFHPGDEIVLSKLDHEAHLSAWVQLAKWKGLKIKWWVPSKNTRTNPKLEAADLRDLDLITERTRIICFTHVSNVSGSIADVASLTKAIKEINPTTLISVDAVAYAPHARIDVKAFGVDFYFFSWYKVYGPHLATAYISSSAQQQLDSLGHYFLPKDSANHLLGLNGFSYELVQSIPAIVSYVEKLSWDWIEGQEAILQREMLQFILSRPEIQLYGDPKADRSIRVPVITFRVKGCSSSAVVQDIYARSICTPTSGHFYAKRLCEEVLGLDDAEDGVVRCSFLHYNTLGEVKHFIGVL